jgi:hypothetical protein
MEEYFTMIAGGLAGATPHMISATITAISRLIFEFKGPDFFPSAAQPRANLLFQMTFLQKCPMKSFPR